ncbi:SET domain-containing protein [Jimgerdemannia flammicorona]|uniref:SET domain-containing protein n=1 Tax=Jimgerdemannia flammicorona TaxID=994334 RepID=A0A433BEZ6_9FUNG|nr:SET domain-containing protein [Jimgerdemannia flammicorona]
MVLMESASFQEGELLFSLPRSILLSLHTSDLAKCESLRPELEALEGWNPLILCMMYESQREKSKWKSYFDILPKKFSTPMFWNDDELRHLDGTGVIGKIGKEEAEKAYTDILLPIINAHPEVFSLTVHTVDLFHICGSLIMAYSFEGEPAASTSTSADQSDSDSDSDSDAAPPTVITMVPLADMLNHRTGHNNARLFYEPTQLEMRCIKNIARGEQVYNTYGDRPNADLLRMYGFVDEMNEYDVVEISGNVVVEVCCKDEEEKEQKVSLKRIEFLLEEDILDDYFVLDTAGNIPPELIVTAKILSMPPAEFASMQETQRLPKPKMTPEICTMLLEVLEYRLSLYRTSLEDDDALLAASDFVTINCRNAITVQLGEKRILHTALDRLRVWQPEPEPMTTKEKRSANKGGKDAKQGGERDEGRKKPRVK